MIKFFSLTLNPEPWELGPLGTFRQASRWIPFVAPNKQLQAYQDTVREALKPQLGASFRRIEANVGLSFFFWRRLDDYTTGTGRKHRRHGSDATNLQKGLEDALQGLVIKNDSQVRKVMSEMMDEGPNVDPGFIIALTTDFRNIPTSLSPAMLDSFADDRRRANGPIQLDNDWLI